MSDYFDHNQFIFKIIAEEVEDIVRDNESTERNDFDREIGCHFQKDTIKELEAGIQTIKTAYIYAQRIDCLVSGDESENDFLRRLHDDIKELKK